MTLPKATCIAAKACVPILSDSYNLRLLENNTCNKIKRSVSGIMEQVLHNITPGDPPGLYNIVSPELDSRFDVPNDIPYRKLFDRLVGLSASLVASLPRMSTESKTIMALFAMCGKSTINRLMNEVSRLKNE